MRRTPAFRAATTAALVVAAAGIAVSCSRKEHVVIMHAMTYEPEVLTIDEGDLVVWRNDDVNPHTAVAPGRFDSGAVPAQGTFRVTLTKPGELPYACTLHPMMKGKIIVKEP
jgi:plastocyanin